MSDDSSPQAGAPTHADVPAERAATIASATVTIEPAACVAYVDAALKLHFPALTEPATARVHEQFARIASLAAPVLAFPLDADDEPAPVYRP
jgi:hypothetical protein